MTVQEMALRNEVRQMLNEAGFSRETIKQLVKESIDDIVKNQVNQVLMERKEEDLATVVEDYLKSRLYPIVEDTTSRAIKDKLRWMNFTVTVDMNKG